MPDLDMMDLGRDSPFFGTPAAQLHATIWMMAQSPLMYAGDLPITDPATLNFVTNPLALMINAHSSGLQVAYEGDCRCAVPRVRGNACKLLNSNTTSMGSCVATWWSDITSSSTATSSAGCKAVAVLNIGAKNAITAVSMAQLGLSSNLAYTVTHVYEGHSEVVSKGQTDFAVSAVTMGGVLLVMSPQGTPPAACRG
jgi:hypothetical protein